jgi:LuxR family maltose regulon positive regulatory protein
VVIASRVDPPLALSRLRVRGQLTELRMQDLRFTAEEAASFFHDTMHLSLPPEDVVALERRTEGWIAGLQMAALSLQHRPPQQIADFVEAFARSHRFVVDYLAEEYPLQKVWVRPN